MVALTLCIKSSTESTYYEHLAFEPDDSPSRRWLLRSQPITSLVLEPGYFGTRVRQALLKAQATLDTDSRTEKVHLVSEDVPVLENQDLPRPAFALPTWSPGIETPSPNRIQLGDTRVIVAIALICFRFGFLASVVSRRCRPV